MRQNLFKSGPRAPGALLALPYKVMMANKPHTGLFSSFAQTVLENTLLTLFSLFSVDKHSD